MQITEHNFLHLLDDMARTGRARGFAAQRQRQMEQPSPNIANIMRADLVLFEVIERDGWESSDLLLWSNSGNGYEYGVIMYQHPNPVRAARVLRLADRDERYASDGYRARKAS